MFGEKIINPEYNADMLAATVALHEGFIYQPDDSLFWKQSKGNEDSFLYVTTKKKIPQMLLSKCEFGKENYNLNIIHPLVYDEEDCDG